jgi:hypothetical protein
MSSIVDNPSVFVDPAARATVKEKAKAFETQFAQVPVRVSKGLTPPMPLPPGALAPEVK